MATVYFTNNADSGDGSLRAALASAAANDVVTYADGYFDGVDEIAISLASGVSITKNVVIDARDKRIVLDGQFTTRCLGVAADLALRKVDMINGYSNTSNSAGLYVTNGNVTLDACRIRGCFSKYYGSAVYALTGSVVLNDCLIAGCREETAQVMSASVRAKSGSSVAINRSTIVGDTQRALSAETEGQIVVADSIIQGAYNVPTATSVTPSACGFVAPCPDAIAQTDWNHLLWQAWDFRLTPASPYLTGAAYQSGDKDLLGHARTGSWGCFDGSWIVVGANGSGTVSVDTTVDWLEIASTGVLTLSGADRVLTVNRGVFVETGAAIASSSRGYVVAPSASDCDAATLTAVVCCVSGAGVLDVSATINEDIATIAVTKTQDKAVVVEGSNDGGVSWSPCVLVEDSTTLTSAKAYKFRVFDGEIFVETQVIARTYYYVSQLPEGDFSEPTDWALDKGGTKICADAPTIANGTFDCR